MYQTKKVKTKKKGLQFKNFHKFWFLSQKSFDFPRILGWRPKKKVFSSKISTILLFISKILRCSANSKLKNKKKEKKVFVPKYTRSFMKFGVNPQKLRKNSSCSRFLRRLALFWESKASICTPLAPSLLISSGHSPRLWGTIFVWGAQAVIWGAQPRNAPPWRRACFVASV